MDIRKLSVATLVAVYLLILVGGIVRSTGAGMGCPDWPKCFDRWVPPTQESELPPNYIEQFAEKRKEKNSRLFQMLTNLGLDEYAEKINRSPLYKEERFSFATAWIEYVNRLIGVLIGFFILALVAVSFKNRKEHPVVFRTSVIILILTLFQGWVGSLVVSTNLFPGLISFHMLLAMLIACGLLYIVYKVNKLEFSFRNFTRQGIMNAGVIGVTIFFLVQIWLGINIREQVDVVSKSLGPAERENWLNYVSDGFGLHRIFSVIIVFVILLLAAYIYKQKKASVYSWLIALVLIVLSETIVGSIMFYFGMPAFAQPIHLLLANVGVGVLFYIFIRLNEKQELTYSNEQ